jgi:hypothetical protein
MTERSLGQRGRPTGLALGFVILVAALAAGALVTATPAGAAPSPGCIRLIAQGPRNQQAVINSFEAGERLTFQAGPPTVGGTPTQMTMTVDDLAAGTTVNLSTGWPGTLVYDFPHTGEYFVQLLTLPGPPLSPFLFSFWNVTCGPVQPAALKEFGIPHVLLCSPTLVMRADGTMGHAYEVEFSAWKAKASNIPAGAVPARYYEGVGLDCSNLPGYTDAGRKTDGLGTDFGSLASIVEGAVYPYFKKS